jgi:hypothetical protein
VRGVHHHHRERGLLTVHLPASRDQLGRQRGVAQLGRIDLHERVHDTTQLRDR